MQISFPKKERRNDSRANMEWNLYISDEIAQESISAAAASASASASMDRISQWVSSQEIPSDLTVRIGDSVFPLHKAVMVPKCGYIRSAVAAASQRPSATVEVDLSALPGGADAFEKAARYCYGANFEITAGNAAALRCTAAFLDMQTAEGGLARRVEEFLAQAGLRTLPSAVAVLRSCEGLLPVAQELGIVRRSADAVALKICNETLFPTRSPPGWWTTELVALSPASFHKVVTALRCRRADPEVLATAATAYAELALAQVLADPRDSEHHRALLESVVAVLPSATDAPLPAAFLCRLLHAAVSTVASAKTCRDLELRVAAVLDQATAGDLLAVALDGAGERVTNTDTVRRIIAAFVERQAASEDGANGRGRRASLSGAELGSGALEKVAKTVDDLAAEIATEEALPISKFVGVAGAVPKDARASHDCLYRAVDIYLKTHPALDEIEREKVCSVMDPLKLSYQARLHASQNKRLPLQAVLSALYYDQLKLRSAAAAAAAADDDGWEGQSAAGAARAQARADASLARENEALRLELAQMRAYVSGMQHSKGSGSRAPAAKKASFLGSVSRTLSRLNPFKGGWAKDTSSIADGRHRNTMHDHHVVKPKRRRFSIG
ncbi:root phototropism protein 2-like [Phragmites australis]|uniref:root phototropism protein 2-like n=1 Tax=Phragmites australis TaxID=29695 RepID=UPI002D7A281C|nr:root phototropism protein 2-like [Phragmites australis]